MRRPDDPEQGELGERIRARRLALRLTQAELGAPFTKSYISAIERGRALPSLQALWLIAGRLGISVEALVGHGDPRASGRYRASRRSFSPADPPGR